MTLESIRMKYDMTPELIGEAAAVISRQQTPETSRLRSLLIFAAFAGVGVVGGLWLIEANPRVGLQPGLGYAVAALVGAVVAVVAVAAKQRGTARRIMDDIRQTGVFDHPVVAEFSASGAVFRQVVGESRTAWRGILGIHEGPTSVVLNVSGRGLAVPVAALPDGLTAQSFLDRLRAWKAGA